MAKITVSCDVCQTKFRGGVEVVKLAERCRQQPPPTFNFQKGEIIAHMMISSCNIKLNRRTGCHEAVYMVITQFPTHRRWNRRSENKICNLAERYFKNRDLVDTFQTEGLPSVKLGHSTFYHTEKGWYEDRFYSGGYVPRTGTLILVLHELLRQKNAHELLNTLVPEGQVNSLSLA